MFHNQPCVCQSATPNGLPELRRTPAHDLALAHQLGIELATVERQVDVEIDTVKCAIRSVHALKVLLKVLAGQIRGKGHHFLDACGGFVRQDRVRRIQKQGYTYVDPWYTLDTHPHRTRIGYPRTSGWLPAQPGGRS